MKSKIILFTASLFLSACASKEPLPDFTPPSYPPPVISGSVPVIEDGGVPPVSSGDETLCIQVYEPVCGKIQIQCITTPCDPIWETFSNRCEAEKRDALEIKEGVCE